MSIGKKIKNIRKSLGLTQRELGDKIGKSEISIRKYESGSTNIPVEVLLKIAYALNVDPKEIVSDIGEGFDHIEIFKQYLESKDHYVNDILFIEEMESHISEYVKFKLYERSLNEKNKID